MKETRMTKQADKRAAIREDIKSSPMGAKIMFHMEKQDYSSYKHAPKPKR